MKVGTLKEVKGEEHENLIYQLYCRNNSLVGINKLMKSIDSVKRRTIGNWKR